MLSDCDDMELTATPVAVPFVLSKAIYVMPTYTAQ
jgi:hypothetical protein